MGQHGLVAWVDAPIVTARVLLRCWRSGDDAIAAIDPTSGRTRWSRTNALLDPAMTVQAPGLRTVVVDDALGARTGRVHALHPLTGKERWSASARTNRVLAVNDDVVL